MAMIKEGNQNGKSVMYPTFELKLIPGNRASRAGQSTKRKSSASVDLNTIRKNRVIAPPNKAKKKLLMMKILLDTKKGK